MSLTEAFEDSFGSVNDPRMARRRARLVRFVQPVQEFIETESAGGLALVAAALFALLWANSPWSEAYGALLDTHVVVDVAVFRVDESLHFWINDVAMVLFFFVVGLEVKRELVLGELNSLRRVAMPLAAAAGGMLVPLAFFLLVAQGAEARNGWGVPMATDIAFALGVMALLGRRVSAGLKVLLLAVAIFDDIGAVVVIAIFYTETVALGPLAIAAGAFVVVAAMDRVGVRRLPLYVLAGGVAWAAVLQSGVHPTIVGVALGLLTPTRAWYHPDGFIDIIQRMMRRFQEGMAARLSQHGREQQVDALLTISDLSRESISPLDRLQHELHPWVAFLVLPLFAWANAGVSFGGGTLGETLTASLTWAVVAGLVLGKPVGLVAAYFIAQRLGAEGPPGVDQHGVFGIGLLAGIGFTIALFVTELAYAEELLVTQAKVGILIASLLSGAAGYLVLRAMPHPPHPE